MEQWQLDELGIEYDYEYLTWVGVACDNAGPPPPGNLPAVGSSACKNKTERQLKNFSQSWHWHTWRSNKKNITILHIRPSGVLSRERVTGVGGCHCYLFVVLARLSVSIRDMSTIQLGKRQLTTGAANEMVKGSLPGLKSVGGSEGKTSPLPNL